MQTAKATLTLALVALLASTGFANRQLLAPTPAPAPGPISCSTVAATASDAGLTILLEAVTAAGLAPTLEDPNLAYTVFAPTDEAFVTALSELNITAAELLGSPDLLPILENHLLAYPLTVENLIEAKTVKTQYNFDPLTITADTFGNETLVEVSTPLATANIVIGDVLACKSYVHVIDAVLVPAIGTASA